MTTLSFLSTTRTVTYILSAQEHISSSPDYALPPQCIVKCDFQAGLQILKRLKKSDLLPVRLNSVSMTPARKQQILKAREEMQIVDVVVPDCSCWSHRHERLNNIELSVSHTSEWLMTKTLATAHQVQWKFDSPGSKKFFCANV